MDKKRQAGSPSAASPRISNRGGTVARPLHLLARFQRDKDLLRTSFSLSCSVASDPTKFCGNCGITLGATIAPDGDELRAEAVGLSARGKVTSECHCGGASPEPRYKLYYGPSRLPLSSPPIRRTQKLLDEVPASPSDMSTEILRMHSAIMSNLYQSDGESIGTEANWAAVVDRDQRAQKSLHDRLGDTDTAAILLDRYISLERSCGPGHRRHFTPRRHGRSEIVDILAGLDRPADSKPQVAALILISQREALCLIAGNTTACLLGLPLPEQIFRVWAFWALGLNYLRD